MANKKTKSTTMESALQKAVEEQENSETSSRIKRLLARKRIYSAEKEQNYRHHLESEEESSRAVKNLPKKCPKYDKFWKTCKVCMCFMPLKTKLRWAECPEGKWK